MRSKDLESLLGSALAPMAPQRLNGARGPWSWPSPSGRGAEIGIVVDSRWVSLRCRAAFASEHSSLERLSRHAGWSGNVKWACAFDDRELRADIPLLLADTAAGRDWLVRQLRAACAGLHNASEQAACIASPRAADGPPPDLELLAFECARAGWPAGVKPNGEVHVDLVVRGMARTVVIRPRPAELHAAVAFAADRSAGAKATCRAAAAQFLLRASATLRWARAFARDDVARDEDDRLTGVGFECSIATPLEARALPLAVDTLISACDLFGCEVELLLERPEIAQAYLQQPPVDEAEPGQGAACSLGAVATATTPVLAAQAAVL